MFGRTRAVLVALLVTQLAGCCCCCRERHCFRPFFNRWHDGGAPCDGCTSCYGPAPLAAGPVVPVPPATIAPPPAGGSGTGTGTSTDGKIQPIPSFNASIYGTSRSR
jgi:hypothetical protein